MLYFRVRAFNPWGKSDYSNVVVIGLTKSIGEDVFVYPNPASDRLRISEIYTEADEAQVIYVSGKVTPVRLDYYGDGSLSLDISDLPNGVYILRMIVDRKVIQKRFIKG